MPFEGPYAFPLEGPNFDRSVARSADDGILVDGECVYWSRMPSRVLYLLEGPQLNGNASGADYGICGRRGCTSFRMPFEGPYTLPRMSTV